MKEVLCNEVFELFDDSFHADLRNASPNNCLVTHPMYTQETSVCVYELPGFSPIVIPGLGESVFHTPVTRLYFASGRMTPFECVRIPALHVLLNQALKAVDSGIDYDWPRFQSNLEGDLLSMLGQVINSRAMRTREGDGAMALAQVNPNQSINTLGVGAELAKDLAKLMRKKDKNFAVSDLNGMLVRTCLRFPATRSSGVKRWMILRVVGRGRCCWLHPVALKEHMLGDVDGDEIYFETDPHLRRTQYDPFISIEVPCEVLSIKRTIGLSECIGAM